jgi:topoisomerase-4 subunit A
MEVYDADAKLIVAADDGRGFLVRMEDCLAQTKNGKQVLNVSGSIEAKLCKVVGPDHDHIAVMGDNRKMIVFDLEQIPEMGKGRGVILQRYKDGGLSDLKTFKWDDGLSYKYGSGETLVEDLNPWLGERAQAGRLPPNGFPRSKKFG